LLLLLLLLQDAFRSTSVDHHNILSASRGWLRQLIVHPQVILINFQASLYVNTLGTTYLREVIIVLVVIVFFFVITIENTFSRTSLRD